MAEFFQRRQHTQENANSWEKTLGAILTPFESFAKKNTSSGILLVICTIIALIVANSPLKSHYQNWLHTPIALTVGNQVLNMSLQHWINDGLMAIFFCLVGIEIKREILIGELSSIKQALLPIMAALGGMLVPALLYHSINHVGASVSGWGIPMATDIAFAIAILHLLGSRVPTSVMTILAALAIVDDLGAVLVIAIFYTDKLAISFLLAALACFIFLLLISRMGVRWLWLYLVVSVGMWVFLLFSGVHATIAGVLTAFAIPVRSLYKPLEFSADAHKLLEKLDSYSVEQDHEDFLNSNFLTGILHTFEKGIHKASTLSQRLEYMLEGPVYFFIVPLFVLANAGITLDTTVILELGRNPVILGTMLGLLAGKFIGVTGAIALCHFLGLAKLPDDIRWAHVIGIGLLAGVGFTMSIFIAELAFSGAESLLLYAKTAVLLASLLAGLGGYLWLYSTSKKVSNA